MAEWNFDPLQAPGRNDALSEEEQATMWDALDHLDYGGSHDLGDFWSSDTWNEPFEDDDADVAVAPHSRHVNEHEHHPTLPLNNHQTSSHTAAFLPDLQSFDALTAHPDVNHHHHESSQHPNPDGRQSNHEIQPHAFPTDSLPPSTLLQSGTEGQQHDYRHIPNSHSEVLNPDNDDMPPHNRRQSRNSNLVDLTRSPEMPTSNLTQQSRTRKRNSISGGEEAGSANKRTKRASISAVEVEDEEPQEEAPSAEEELLKAQQQEALKMQEANKDEGAVKIGQRTCIICLENYTNATISSCGHIFCHECLIRALMASEKNNDRGAGNCPACRKAIHRKRANQVIPVNFLKKSAFKTKGRQAHNR